MLYINTIFLIPCIAPLKQQVGLDQDNLKDNNQ